MADQNLKIRIQAIDTTQRIFKAVASRLNSLRKTVFSFRTALVSLAGAGGFGFLIKSSMDSIDKISKLSRTLGISVADLRKLEYAADLSGLSVDTVARAVRNLNRVMVDFQGGTGDAKDAFDELGITSDDLNAVMGDQFKVLELLADRFGNVENSAVRSSIAQDLFGGRASEMLLVLEEGADGLAQISDEAERFGLLLSASAAKGVEDANDSFTRLFALFKGLRDSVVSFLAPAIKAAVEKAQEFIEGLMAKEDGVKNFAKKISLSIVNAIQTFAETMAFLINIILGAVNAIITAMNFLTEEILKTSMSEEKFAHKTMLATKALNDLLDKTHTLHPEAQALVHEFDELARAGFKDANALKDLANRASQLHTAFTESRITINKNQKAMASVAHHSREMASAINVTSESMKKLPYLPRDFEIQFSFLKAQIEEAAKAGENLDDVMTTGTDTSSDFGENLKKLAEDARNFGKNMEDVVIRGIQSFEDALVSAVTGTMKLKDAFKQMAASIISDIIRMTIRMQISAPIAEFLAGAMPFGSTGGTSKLGTKAVGGSVSAGQPYMVGERGAELFIPGGSGTIIPNNQLGGGGTVVNQTINLSTGVSQTVRAEVMNMLPQIADAAKGAVIDAKRRGGRFGTAFGV